MYTLYFLLKGLTLVTYLDAVNLRKKLIKICKRKQINTPTKELSLGGR